MTTSASRHTVGRENTAARVAIVLAVLLCLQSCEKPRGPETTAVSGTRQISDSLIRPGDVKATVSNLEQIGPGGPRGKELTSLLSIWENRKEALDSFPEVNARTLVEVSIAGALLQARAAGFVQLTKAQLEGMRALLKRAINEMPGQTSTRATRHWRSTRTMSRLNCFALSLQTQRTTTGALPSWRSHICVNRRPQGRSRPYPTATPRPLVSLENSP